MNKVLSLTDQERALGLATASTGNHGLGLARAVKEIRAKGTVFVPENADAAKITAIREYGAAIQYTKAGLSETDAHALAKQFARDNHMTWVSPYNDDRIIAGQGTIAVELVKQLADIDAVFITVGGGGLIAGIATYLHAVSPHTKVIGCLPENSAEMYHSVKAGEFVYMESKSTLSDGSGGGFEKGSVTFPLCQELVDDWVLVTENDIKDAVKLVFESHELVIEGAAGVAVASFVQRRKEFAGQNVVILICGGNVSPDTFQEMLA